MSEPPQPDQPRDDNRLEYWQPATDPTSMGARVASLIAGMFVRFLLTAFAGGMCIAVLVSGRGHSMSLIGIAAAVAWVGVAIVCIVHGIGTYRRNRTFPDPTARTAGRFFHLGFLLGCGITALLEGICYSVAAFDVITSG